MVSPQIGFDKTNLRTEYNRVQAIANGNTAGTYKQSSWMAMHIDLDEAQKMLDDANDGNRTAGGAMSQSDVDTSTGILHSYPSILQGAVSGEPTGADPIKTKADLQAFYNKVKDVQQSNYPGNSNWTAFKTARDSAGYSFEPSHAGDSQYQVTLAYDLLYHAVKQLDSSLLPTAAPAPAPAPAPSGTCSGSDTGTCR